MKTRRSNLLQFNDWMTDCVMHLEKSSHPTDRVLTVWFELQQITDEATSSFDLDHTTSTTPLTEARVQAVLRWFDKRMELLRRDTPNEILTGSVRFESHSMSVVDLYTPSSDDTGVPRYYARHIRTRGW